jgi:hypothetical protein
MVDNVKRANELEEALENHRAYTEGLIRSHRIELADLKSSYAADLAQLKKEPNESHSNEKSSLKKFQITRPADVVVCILNTI